MGEVFHKIDPAQSIMCSSCKGHPECEAHLYQCPARRIVMYTFLQEELGGGLQDNYTCPELGQILMTSLHCEVAGGLQAFQSRHGVDDPKFAALLQSQTNLGWSQLFQGRLTQEWGQLQDKFLANNNDEFKLDRQHWMGALWTRKLISLLWRAMRAQWDLRTADRHGRTKEANHAIRHARLLQSITALHINAPNMLAADRDILAEPLSVKLQHHPSRLELWLHRTRAIVHRSTTDATSIVKRTHARTTKFFQPRSTTQPLGPRDERDRHTLHRISPYTTRSIPDNAHDHHHCQPASCREILE
jgi:hypothetical protein